MFLFIQGLSLHTRVRPEVVVCLIQCFPMCGTRSPKGSGKVLCGRALQQFQAQFQYFSFIQIAVTYSTTFVFYYFTLGSFLFFNRRN